MESDVFTACLRNNPQTIFNPSTPTRHYKELRRLSLSFRRLDLFLSFTAPTLQVTDTTRSLEDQISALKRERDELVRILGTHECNNPGLEQAAHGSQMCQQQQQQQLQYNHA